MSSVRSRVDESIVLNGFGCAWRLHSSYTAKSLIRSKRMSDLKGIEYKRFEDILREKLDTKVKIKDKKIEISFTSVADLNRILEIIDIKD